MIAAAARRSPGEGKLLVLRADGQIDHARRGAWIEHLQHGDLVVANDAGTLPASLRGLHRRSGAAIEVRLAGHRRRDPFDVTELRALVFGDGDFRTPTEARVPPPPLMRGDRLELGPLLAVVLGTLGHPRLVALRFEGTATSIWEGIARHGRPVQYAHVPHPLEPWDVATPIAGLPVAFEAPSAGFILDWRTLGRLVERGIDFATITHAAGLSSTGDVDLDRRLPFDEAYRIPQRTAQLIARVRQNGGRIVAIGTTVVRALEHASTSAGGVSAGAGLATQRIGGHTRLWVVDALVSGTHEAGTSHFEMLRAFAEDATLYRAGAALDRYGYRTHEFGDSMLVERSRLGRSRGTAPRIAA